MSETSGTVSGSAAAETAPPIIASVLVIGNEILSGRTQDANVAFIARGLTELGIRLREVRIIPDDPPTIVAAVRDASGRFDYVFTTGGIGPTHDDITAECVAQAFDVPLVEDPEARRRIAEQCAARGVELNAARLRMAQVPQGATLIDNAVSVAPGFQIGNVFVMAGVPMIAQSMFAAIRSRLVGGPVLLSRTVSCRLAEGQVAEPLAELQLAYPDIEIGSYPAWVNDGPLVSLVLRGTDPATLERAVAAVEAMITSCGGEPLPPPERAS
jgi:molybdenum cofactor synthesis domain-containing protein